MNRREELKRQTPKHSERFSIVNSGDSIQVITDHLTGREYMVFFHSRGIQMTELKGEEND